MYPFSGIPKQGEPFEKSMGEADSTGRDLLRRE